MPNSPNAVGAPSGTPGGATIRLATACLTVWALSGCARDHPTAPPAATTTPRVVGIALADSLGAPLASATLSATSLFDVNGFAVVLFETTDGAGEAALNLLPGPWILSARATDGRVAGAHAVILAATPASDSILVRLEAHAPSRIEGHVRLAGRIDHRGIIVSAIGIGDALAVTDSTGAYALYAVPPGTWTVFCGILGFADGFTNVTVTTPGSVVTAPDIQLNSSPAPR
jgi:hypothetical protein